MDGQTGGDSWRNFVYDFQTLITGILAIGAAYFTIRSAQKIDERQQARHEEFYDLQTRPDKLRLARALPNFTQAKFFGSHLMSWDFPILADGFATIQKNDQAELARLERVCQHMLSYLTADEINAVQNMFDGELNVQFNDLARRARHLLDQIRMLKVSDGHEVDFKEKDGFVRPIEMNAAIRQDIYMAAFRSFANARVNFFEFVERFESLARQYKIL